MKYLILGNGYLGNKLNDFLEDSILSKRRISSVKNVEEEIKKHNPEFVINCIGKNGVPNIDWCETHKEETMFSNVVVPSFIMKSCKELNKKMVHLSSGCIYYGNNDGKGFSEQDEPNFQGSYYSRTKILAESMLKQSNVLQIRLRMPIDGEPNDRNLLTKLLKYDKLINIPNSITVVNDFLKATKALMDKNSTGIFNVVNPQPETHKELINLYNKYSDNKKECEFVNPIELKMVAPRSNCVLSTNKLESLGIHMTSTAQALKECVKQYVKLEKLGK